MERPHLKDEPLPMEGQSGLWRGGGCSRCEEQEGSVRETEGGMLLAPGRTERTRGPVCITSAGWGFQEMTWGHHLGGLIKAFVS